MKKISVFVMVLAMLFIFSGASYAGLGDGLVAYWPFNGNAIDESGNGNNGNVVGPTLTVDRNGNSNSAYRFDGVNDYIDIPYSALIEPSVFSLSLWFKSSTSNAGVLLSSDPDGYICNHGYGIALYGKNMTHPWPVKSEGTLSFFVDTSPQCNDGSWIFSDSSAKNDGEWHHMVAMYDGSSMSMYIDGILQQETENLAYMKTHASIRIGMLRYSNHQEWRSFYQGSIDDILLYNRVLSKSEILDIFLKAGVFVDIPPGYWAEAAIYNIYNAGITTGCSQNPLKYCPENTVTRTQMAVFLGRAVHGSSFIPPSAIGYFSDVPVTYWAADWIEQFYRDGITSGCSTNPPRYCPYNPVTRAQMAIFLLRSKHGKNYTPPSATGIFSDVPTSYWAAAWIEQLYKEGITTGCGTGPLRYCPENSVTRAQMAVFMMRTFGL